MQNTSPTLSPRSNSVSPEKPLHLVRPPAQPQPAAAQAPQARLCHPNDLLNAWQADANASHQARVQGVPRGPITGFKELDRELGGALAPGLHVLHGQPGSGKTAFALQVAASCGCPALYVSCEMSPLELLRRLTARVTNTYLGRLKSGEMRPEESTALARAALAEAPGLRFIDATQNWPGPAYLLECAQIVRETAASLESSSSLAPHMMIVVDSVHAWADGAAAGSASGATLPGSSEYETLNAAITSLRQLSAALSCPILIISERNRDSMKTGGLSAGAGTRKLEYGAETVIDLAREEGNRESFAGEVDVRARLQKNRHGAAGKDVALKFHGALQRFS